MVLEQLGSYLGEKIKWYTYLTSYAKIKYILNTFKYKRGIHKNTRRK